MKKKYYIGLVFAITLISLIGCGKDKEKTSKNETSIEVSKDADIPDTVNISGEQTDVDNASSDAESTDSAAPENELITAIDNTIYNELGVLITFDGISDEGGYYKGYITIDNQNPDNKKVMISNTKLYLNGIPLFRYQYESNIDNFDGYLSGSKTKAEFTTNDTRGSSIADSLYLSDGTLSAYTYAKELLDYADIPIETVGIHMDIRIGSDSEDWTIERTIYTNKNNNEDLTNFFGELSYVIPTDEYDALKDKYEMGHDENMMFYEPANVYYKENSNGGITLTVTQDTVYGYDSNLTIVDLYVNGKKIEPDYIWGENKDCTHEMCIKRYNKSDEEIRRTYEISNNDPLTYSIGYPGTDYREQGGFVEFYPLTHYVDLFTR